MAIHIVLGTRGECFLSRDCTDMVPRKRSPVVHAQWQQDGEAKPLVLKRFRVGVRNQSDIW